MSDEERPQLLEGLFRISGSRNQARPIELAVVVQSEARPWRFPPTCDFLYGEWLRHEFEVSGPPQPEPMPDLPLLITMVLAGDHPLTGPPPAQVLAPVPHADLVRATVAGIPGLLQDLDDDTRNAGAPTMTSTRCCGTGGRRAVRALAAGRKPIPALDGLAASVRDMAASVTR